jgi:hypothetical protein
MICTITYMDVFLNNSKKFSNYLKTKMGVLSFIVSRNLNELTYKLSINTINCSDNRHNNHELLLRFNVINELHSLL